MKRFAYLDIEATHTNWIDAQIIEIAFIIKDETGKDLDYFHSLIRPSSELSEDITHLTGITESMLKNAPEFYKVAHKIQEKLSDSIIVAHKAAFDYDLLRKQLKDLDIELTNKRICTLELSQRLIPELNSYALKSLCELAQIEIPKHHRALDDATALSKLHTYLRLINGELTKVEKYLPKHKKLIHKTCARPGVIVIRNGKKREVFKSENLKKKLEELLLINPKNKERQTQFIQIDVTPTGSLIQAGLIQSKLEKTIYPFCLYQVKNKEGKILLRIGKTDIKRPALYYFSSKIAAKETLKRLIPKKQQTDTIRQNIALKQELKKLIAFEKNYLIRSAETLNSLYQYTLIRGDKTFARFESSKFISSSKEIDYNEIKFKKMGPREYMSLNHSLKWIKNQKSKTDILIEIKKFLR